MQEIKLNDINLESLKRLNNRYSTYSTLYTDGETVYKIFQNPRSIDNRGLRNNFKDMEGLPVEGVILPKDLIVDDDILEGYTMPLFKNSETLSSKFSTIQIDKQELSKAFRKASLIIRQMHNNGIICQDVSLENILMDAQGNVAICDPDSFSNKNYYSGVYSKIFIKYLLGYRKTKLRDLRDIDRVSLVLAYYYLLFDKEIQNVSKRQYNKLAREMITVENLRLLRDLLIDKKRSLDCTPYMDSLISYKDVGTLDKNKYLTLGQKTYNAVNGLMSRN